MNIDYRRIDKYKLWLSVHCKNSGTMKKLLAIYMDAENVFREMAYIKAKGVRGVSPSIIQTLSASNPDKVYDKLVDVLTRGDIDVILYDGPFYPEKLKRCPDAPSLLFSRGKLFPPLFCSIGIVGTRDYSDQGSTLCDKYSARIAMKRATVVSGMAKGIDTIAAQSALRVAANDYPTIAVLGSGVDVPTPVENRRLYEKIIERGTVISQFMPGEPATRYTYPMRNKIIAGLSDALLVIEAGKTSGALITANAAQKYGRPVYTVPARVTDRSFAGSNLLLKDGRARYADEAHLFVQSVYKDEDFHPDYDIPEPDYTGTSLTEEERTIDFIDREVDKYLDRREMLFRTLDADSKKIYNALVREDKTFDQLVLSTGMSPPVLNRVLAVMEVNNQVIQIYGRRYRLIVYENTPRL